MVQGSRLIDNGFLGRHRLYHRCKNDDIIDGRIIPAKIRIDRPSVNWSKYGKPWDVIFDDPGCGIVQFVVRNLPKELPRERPIDSGTRICSFFPSHDPLCFNYAHCEIRPFHDGKEIASKSLGKIVKKEFRTVMSNKGLLLLAPSV